MTGRVRGPPARRVLSTFTQHRPLDTCAQVRHGTSSARVGLEVKRFGLLAFPCHTTAMIIMSSLAPSCCSPPSCPALPCPVLHPPPPKATDHIHKAMSSVVDGKGERVFMRIFARNLPFVSYLLQHRDDFGGGVLKKKATMDAVRKRLNITKNLEAAGEIPDHVLDAATYHWCAWHRQHTASTFHALPTRLEGSPVALASVTVRLSACGPSCLSVRLSVFFLANSSPLLDVLVIQPIIVRLQVVHEVHRSDAPPSTARGILHGHGVCSLH